MNLKELLESEIQGDKLTFKQFERIIKRVINMSATITARHILEDMTHMERLEAVVYEKSAELQVYKAIIEEKGLEKEFNERLAVVTEQKKEVTE